MRVKVTIDRKEIEEALREWLKAKGVVAEQFEFTYWCAHLGTWRDLGKGSEDLKASTQGPHEKLMPNTGPYR